MSWFRKFLGLFGRGAQERAGVEDALAPSDKPEQPTTGKEACIGLYMFSRQEVSSVVPVWYGEYTDGIVLRALAKALQPHGGWQLTTLDGCHGDLFAETLGTLRQWIRRGTYKIDITGLEEKVLQQLQSIEELPFVPCIIGIGTIGRARLLGTHQQLKSSGAAGYLGVMTLQRESVVDIARELGLLYEGMTIRDDVSGPGWQAGEDDLRVAGLRK
jgi:hypothetical protein